MKEAIHDHRIVGWLLAVALGIHLILLRAGSPLVMSSLFILAVGIILRGRQIFAPTWLGRTLLLAGLLAVLATRQGKNPVVLVGEFAGLAGAILLLRQVTPARGLRVIFCILGLLIATVFRRDPGVGGTFIVLDVAALLFLTEQVHRPPEAALSFWVSLKRSMRVIAPVSVIVVLIFWLFPNLYLKGIPAITGFSGSNILNPGQVAELRPSRRVALVATFAENQTLPAAADLYWRGQVLENNEGLKWSRDPNRTNRPRSLQGDQPPAGTVVWNYTQDVGSNLSEIIPALDRVVTAEGTRGGQEIAVLEFGASVLKAVGSGAMRLSVTSADDPVADAPEPTLADGSLGLPDTVKNNEALGILAGRIFRPALTPQENVDRLAHYLNKGKFTYTLRPGRIPNLDTFLLRERQGFCEHYAAAAANLLRLGGLPARIVVGYRGGDWNPWNRTITVRDSDAHAWVEVWDASRHHWLRFDPTSYVAPRLTTRMEQEMNSDDWSWYRLTFTYLAALLASATATVRDAMSLLGASEIWESLQPVLFVGLLLGLSVWLVRRLVLRSRGHSHDLPGMVLADLESRAARSGRGRQAGESPLAWLARLGQDPDPNNGPALAAFASAYQQAVYSRTGLTPDTAVILRTQARRLRAAWKTQTFRPAPTRDDFR